MYSTVFGLSKCILLTAILCYIFQLVTRWGSYVDLVHLELVSLIPELTARVHRKTYSSERRPVGTDGSGPLSWRETGNLEKGTSRWDASNVFRNASSALTSLDTERPLCSGECGMDQHPELTLLSQLLLYRLLGGFQLFRSDSHRTLCYQSLSHHDFRVMYRRDLPLKHFELHRSRWFIHEGWHGIRSEIFEILRNSKCIN